MEDILGPIVLGGVVVAMIVAFLKITIAQGKRARAIRTAVKAAAAGDHDAALRQLMEALRTPCATAHPTRSTFTKMVAEERRLLEAVAEILPKTSLGVKVDFQVTFTLLDEKATLLSARASYSMMSGSMKPEESIRVQRLNQKVASELRPLGEGINLVDARTGGIL